MSQEALIQALLDHLRGRCYGKHEGVVTDTDDPLGLGRIRAKVPAVLGEDTTTGWALPCTPAGGGRNRGLLWLPEVGDSVWIEFAAGDLSRPIWTGGWWGAPEASGDPDELGEGSGAETPEAEGGPAGPGRVVLRTTAGHRLLLDDDGGLVILTEAAEKSEIRLEGDGSVTVKAQGATLTLSGGNITVQADNQVTIDGPQVTVKANLIKLGSDGAAHPVPLGDLLVTAFSTHTHLVPALPNPTGATIPTLPPAVPLPPSVLSTKVLAE